MNNNFLPYQLKKNAEQNSTLATQLAQNATRLQNIFIDVSKPPSPLVGIDGTESDVVPKLNNIISGITANQITLFFPDNTYNFLTAFNPVNKNLKMVGSFNTIFAKKGNNVLIKVNGSYDVDMAVTSIDADHKTVNLASTTGLSVGDVIQIYSDDVIPNRRFTTYQGEFFVINSVLSTKIISSTPLRSDFAYTTNPRIRRLAKIPFAMENIQVRDDVAGTETNDMIQLNDLHKPILKNITCLYSKNPFITLYGCYGYEVTNPKSVYQLDDSANGHYGYGINDCGCGFGVIDGMDFRYLRHGFTTNSNTTGRGETHHTIIRNSKVTGSNLQSFDTHENGYNIVFDNCTAFNSAAYGFAARSNSIFTNCKVVNSQKGLYAFNNGVQSCQNVKFNNCTLENLRDISINISVDTGTVQNIEFNNCKIDGDKELTIDSATNVVFRNCHIKVNNSNYLARISNGDVTFLDCTFEFTNLTFGEYYLFSVTNATVKVRGGTFRGATGVMLLGIGNTGTNTLKVKGLVVDGTVKLINSKPVRNDTNFATLITDYSFVESAVKKGTMTYNGDGSTTSKQIPHYLGIAPTYWHVERGSNDAGVAGIKYVTADATNLTVYFNTAPISGTNNVVLVWRAES